MKLDGVWKVDEGDTYHNRVPNIEVYVEPASVTSVKKQIPASVNAIPVEIVPGEMPEALPAIGYLSSDPVENARRARQAQERARARERDEPSYTQVVQTYGESWEKVPGVLGMGPKCDSDGCDFSTIEVTVQRELLPGARSEIPGSVNGVRIELVPD